jgi:hypothetical protein
MADSVATLKFAKKTKLELEFEAAARKQKRDEERAEKAENLRQKRAAAAKARTFRVQVKELLSVFRKKTPIKITEGSAGFTFLGVPYHIVYDHWTLGGNTSDVDDYETKHEGWVIYPDKDWSSRHTLYEVEKYATPPRLKPSPEAFSRAIVAALKEFDSTIKWRERNFGNRYPY